MQGRAINLARGPLWEGRVQRIDRQIYLAVLSSFRQNRCALQDNERRGTDKYRVYPIRWSSGGLAEGLPSNLIVNQVNKTKTIMVHRKGIIHCSCGNALYPAQAIQSNKCSLKRFSTFKIWRIFLNASAGHWYRCGGLHAARRPVFGPHWTRL